MFEKILVPLSGSASAEAAIPYAAEIASKNGSEVILAHVNAQGNAGSLRSYLESVRVLAERRLSDSTNKAKAIVRTDLLTGEPVEGIQRYAGANGCGLIVMAGGSRSMSETWLTKNVTWKMVCCCRQPLLIVKTDSDRAGPDKKLIGRIMVSLDGSKLAETAIPYAEKLADILGSELRFFRVIEPYINAYVGDRIEVPAAVAAERREKAGPAVRDYLSRVGARIKATGLNTLTDYGFGVPAEEIINYARSNMIDLIVMSTHGRSGVGRWALGSVTRGVLQSSDTPVMVIRRGISQRFSAN